MEKSFYSSVFVGSLLIHPKTIIHWDIFTLLFQFLLGHITIQPIVLLTIKDIIFIVLRPFHILGTIIGGFNMIFFDDILIIISFLGSGKIGLRYRYGVDSI